MFRRVCGWFLFPLFICFVGGFAFAQTDDDARFQAHLQAGEFGLAKKIAVGQKNPAAADALLAELAAAQGRNGSRRGSLATTYDIQSDRVRSNLAMQLRQQNLGGGVQADFDSLIELITSTIAPSSWQDVGGPGSIEQFPAGVRVDPTGLMQKLDKRPEAFLLALRKQAALPTTLGKLDPRRISPLRKVSLRRLEQAVQAQYAAGLSADDVQQHLAGLQRVQYVFIYPDQRDVVIAGPASGWKENEEGRTVSLENERPVMQLDDLVVVLRNAFGGPGKFGCSITPTKTGLAAAKATSEKWAANPLKPGQRDRWLGELRDSLGKQDIEVDGIDPRSRAALILVEADYRMKLVGMGLEPGTVGVTSYFANVNPAKPPKMDVLRWWFELNYQPLRTTAGNDAFALRGTGVKVLSENEKLTPEGERVHTGQANEPTAAFADSFTQHFEALAAKYPIYAELRNVFDLAIVAAILEQEDVPGQLDWELTHFGPDGAYAPHLGQAPQQVQTIINHRSFENKAVIAGASGGVVCHPPVLVDRSKYEIDRGTALRDERAYAQPKELARGVWWWD